MRSNVRDAVPDQQDQSLSTVEAAAAFNAAFSRDERILVAVSGGPDSMAMLGLFVEWGGATLHAVTVDHGLRAESPAEAQAVAEACRTMGVPHTILSWQGDKPRSSLQKAARSARYAMLCDFARTKNFTCIATAHHADDQAETVLMRLTSGSGISGLAGMKVESERFETQGDDADAPVRHIRPLLGFSKAQLVSSCKVRGISFVNDPSNENASFERVRVRRIFENLALEGLSGERLLRLSERAALADEALEYAAEVYLSKLGLIGLHQRALIDWRSLFQEPKAIRQRVLSKLLKRLSSGKFVEKLERIEALVDEIDIAFREGLPLKRSIGHWIVSIDRSGKTTIQAALPRIRGQKL